MKKRVFSGFLALAMLATLVIGAVSSMSWTASTMTLAPYSSDTITVSDAVSITSVTSSDTKVAYVGTVNYTGTTVTVSSLASGTCNITIVYKKSNQATDTCVVPVVVSDGNVTSLIDSSNMTLSSGQTQSDTKYYQSLVNLSSSNTSVATVSTSSDGHYISVTAGSTSGSATITGKGYRDNTWYGINMTVNVTGGTNSTTGVTVSGNQISMQKGNVYTVPTTYFLVTNPTSSNTSVATVTRNSAQTQVIITGAGEGTSTIQYQYFSSTSASAQTATLYVTVGTGTNATSQSVSLAVGGSSLVSNYALVQSPSVANSSVATVSVSGNSLVITGKAAGTTTITFQYKDNLTQTSWYNGTVNVTVTSSSSTTTTTGSGITFSKSSTSVTKGKSYRLSNIKVDGKSVAAADLLWLSADTSVLTVNSKTGVFKAVKTGQTRLIAVDKEGKSVNSILVTVK